MIDFPIPRMGNVTLEDGVLVCRGRQGQVTNVGYVGGDENGNDYLCWTKELTIVQRDDPPAVRLATVTESARYCMGKVSFNVWRRGVQREGSMFLASNTEDAGGETGQFAMYTMVDVDPEPRKRLVISDAYSERSGLRRTRVLMANPNNGLAEFA